MQFSLLLRKHGFQPESFGPVLVYSLAFHALFFAGIVLMTKALYKSHEFERPSTFELVKLSQIFETPGRPASPSAPKPRRARTLSPASAPPVAAPQPVAERNPSPVEKKKTDAPVMENSALAPQTPAAPTGPSPDDVALIDKVYDAGMVDEQPVPIKKTDPFYPEFVKDQGISGMVKAQIIIDQNGNVVDVKILSSPHDLLSDEVVKAVGKWKYRPGKFKGVAVRVKKRDVEVLFQLTD